MLSNKEKESVLNEFPNIKLSYENITHNKVYKSDIIMAIPEGRKSFAWFTTQNEKNVCLIMELGENKQITNVKIVNVCFNSELVYGTIFYGTTFFNMYNKFFAIEDVFYYKGNDVSRYNWGKKFELFNTILSKDIKQISLNNSFMVFGLPLLSDNLDDFYNKVEQIKYRISTVQFRLFERCNNYLFMSFAKFIEQKMLKPINNVKIDINYNKNDVINNNKIYVSNKKPYDRSVNDRSVNDRNKNTREVIFKIKPDIQNDIYQLYCLNDNNKEIYYDTAFIPDFNTSVMMNKLLRKIKENDRLDALEESDDEEEFENENEDRFVYLDKHYNMICLYNYKFKKWYPVRIADKNTEITKISNLNRVR
jgi:hypothetical protein